MSSLRKVMHAAAPCPTDVKWKIMDYFGKGVVWEYYGGSEGGGTMITDEEFVRQYYFWTGSDIFPTFEFFSYPLPMGQSMEMPIRFYLL